MQPSTDAPGRSSLLANSRLLSVLAALVLVVLLATALPRPGGSIERFRDLATQHGLTHRIDPDLVLAVAAIESGGDPLARSRAGARGLMQLLPATALEMAERVRIEDYDEDMLEDPDVNIRLGTAYLRWLADLFGEDCPRTVLAAYNAGCGNVWRWQEQVEHGSTAPTDEELIEAIEFPETRAYVGKVVDVWLALRERRERIHD